MLASINLLKLEECVFACPPNTSERVSHSHPLFNLYNIARNKSCWLKTLERGKLFLKFGCEKINLISLGGKIKRSLNFLTRGM